MAKPILVLFALLAVSCGPLSGVSAGQADGTKRPADLFAFTSDYNDYLGLGQSKSFTPPNSKFVVEPGTHRDYVQLVVERAGDYWSIDMAAPTGHVLEARTYENATDPAFRTDTTPVLLVYGEGRACSRSTGSFTIAQIAFDQKDRLLALRATFVLRCDSPNPGPFRGTLTYGRPATSN
jgi:hypothetical protein